MGSSRYSWFGGLSPASRWSVWALVPWIPTVDCSRQVARLVIDLGFGVISGGAEGCDAEAHRVALEAGHPTVVVLGHGHDHVYPSHHRELFHDIIRSGGATVSPYWPTVPPRGFRFRERNSVIASLSRAVVVVRARLVVLFRPLGLLGKSDVQSSFPRILVTTMARGRTSSWQGAIPLVGPADLATTLGVKQGG